MEAWFYLVTYHNKEARGQHVGEVNNGEGGDCRCKLVVDIRQQLCTKRHQSNPRAQGTSREDAYIIMTPCRGRQGKQKLLRSMIQLSGGLELL